MVGFLERTLARLAAHPASGADKMEAYGVLTGLVQTHALQERRGGVLDDEFVAAQAAFLQNLAGDGRHPHLAAAMAGLRAHTDERFARILRLVLDALLPVR